MVQAGRFGRKAGRGYYDYARRRRTAPEDPEPPPAGRRQGVVAIEGDGPARRRPARRSPRRPATTCARPGEFEQRRLARHPDRRRQSAARRWTPSPTIDDPDDAGAASCAWTAASPSSTLRGGAVGFHALPPFEESRLVELTRSARDPGRRRAQRAEAFFRSLGKHVEWVGDAPGPRARPDRLPARERGRASRSARASARPRTSTSRCGYGYNYPRGPLEWADQIELDHVLATLDALTRSCGEERYRAAPLLRRMVAEGRLGRRPARASSATSELSAAAQRPRDRADHARARS